MHDHESHAQPTDPVFEPPAWEERYAGEAAVWSGRPNAQLVTEAGRLEPGTALDVGCGEGGDVLWLAQQGWRVTGADFSRNGLARAARHLDEAGLGDRADWWQVDARTLDTDGRTWDLVTTHFLHPAEGGMVDVVPRLARAVAPGGHLLVVGHAPIGPHMERQQSSDRIRAMFLAEDVAPAVPDDLEVLVAEQRRRTAIHGGEEIELHDATVLARRPS